MISAANMDERKNPEQLWGNVGVRVFTEEKNGLKLFSDYNWGNGSWSRWKGLS